MIPVFPVTVALPPIHSRVKSQMSLHLVIGGARSGKSRFAEQLAHDSGLAVCVIATAKALDAEMHVRIKRHQRDRPRDWQTVEVPVALAQTLHAQANAQTCLVIDCLTLWLANLLDTGTTQFEPIDASTIPRFVRERTALLDTLPALPGQLVLVANEVGLGLVPDTALGRLFRDEAGRLNQALGQLCDHVTFVAAGLPLKLK